MLGEGSSQGFECFWGSLDPRKPEKSCPPEKFVMMLMTTANMCKFALSKFSNFRSEFAHAWIKVEYVWTNWCESLASAGISFEQKYYYFELAILSTRMFHWYLGSMGKRPRFHKINHFLTKLKKCDFEVK